MKIKQKRMSYREVCCIAERKHIRPMKQSAFWRKLIKFLSRAEMKAVHFTYEEVGMDKLGKEEPCLILMNHSSFTDLQIIGTLFADRQYHIVCTNDAFVGKAWLLRRIGCIPTKKFITDVTLVRDLKYTVETLKSSVVMYPEASYSFDGTQTPLPDSLGKCLKLLKVPVVMVKTEGAFIRDPLYNNLQKRSTDVKATVTYLLSPKDIADKNTEELNQILCDAFVYDHFRTQFEQKIEVKEPFRADGLHRVLYKCPTCMMEGRMHGKGVTIRCRECGRVHRLEESGMLKEEIGQQECTKQKNFDFVTDWYAWEREQVKNEIQNGSYCMDMDVEIKMLVNEDYLYSVGEGRLVHTNEGFVLDGCGGDLHFEQPGNTSYSLYADYFWYEIGDMICVGDNNAQYYCFPKDQDSAIVAKARLATEEIYKMKREASLL